MLPSNNSTTITSAQLKRLQVLYSQYERRSLDATPGRDARIAWATQQLGRIIRSFSNLTADEARRLIDMLQGQMGVKHPTTARRRRMGRRAAANAGTSGRHDQATADTVLAGAEDLARIQYALSLLGWNEETLHGWLSSPSSPLRGRANPAIRTLAEANKVWWGLKRIAKGKGLWVPQKEFRAAREGTAAA